MIWEHLKSVSNRFKGIKDKYGHYSYKQLCENTAIVHFPYQMSIMSLFEQYSMGIPILVPSISFLWQLHDKYDVVTERTWERVRTGKRPIGSLIQGIDATIPDPNNDKSRDAFVYWVKFGDFYRWPHILTFDSWKDLEIKINKTDAEWRVLSESIKEAASRQFSRTLKQWYNII